MSFRLSSMLLSLLVFFSGCGGKVIAPVEGTLVITGGASPAGCMVMFEETTKKEVYSGAVGADGKFRMTTETPGDGVPPGKYSVSVLSAPPADSSQTIAPPPFHAKYVRPETSGLTIEIKPGKNNVPLQLDAP